MKTIFALVKRNCLLFLRNKQTVFFSFFSSLILIALYFLFIGNLYSQGFNEYSGLQLTDKQLNFAIYSQMMMGVMVINSISLSIGMFTFMATDLENRKTEAFLLTNVKPVQLITSYLISALSVSFLLNFIMLSISAVIIGITTFWWNLSTFFLIFLVLILVTFISCSIVLLITTLVKSSAAIGVINGILGTIIGFLCGIYMPFDNLGKGATYVGSLLPFTHLTIWLKRIVLKDVFRQCNIPSEMTEIMQRKWFSAGNIGLCGLDVPLWGMLIFSGVIAIVCFTISTVVLKNRLRFLKNK